MRTTLTGRLILPHDLNGPVFLVGRQPILDRWQNVFGYELLYRKSGRNQGNVRNGDEATLDVLLGTFSQAGLKAIVGSKKAFINLTRNFLVGNYPIPLPPDRTVLEILETTELDGTLMEALKELVHLGYQIAMDDITSYDRVARLIGWINIVKVEINNIAPLDLARLVLEARQRGVMLLAEKVESKEMYQRCLMLGFDLFQGYFFCRPEIVPVRRIATPRMVILQAMAALQNPNIEIKELNRIISMDATMSYRLLKLVNSGYYSFISPITSIQHAITMIGLNQLRAWLSLLLMTNIDDKPRELSMVGLLRAKLAEGFAQEMREPNPPSYFLVGLFSVLDALLDMPMAEVVEGLTLAPEIVQALVRREGKMGKMLRAVEEMEVANWDLVMETNLEPEVINAVYFDSLQWVEKIRGLLHERSGGN